MNDQVFQELRKLKDKQWSLYALIFILATVIIITILERRPDTYCDAQCMEDSRLLDDMQSAREQY